MKVFIKNVFDLSNKVYSELSGLEEKYYQTALGIEFRKKKINFMREAGLELFYENYPLGLHELDFLECAKSAAFAILLTNTESQGYAYMQLLSAGVPCLVFNQDTLYSSPDQPIQSWPATSVPYFDERCGLIEKEISKETIEKFFSVPLQSWDPRSYILENHTIEKSTKKYLKLFILILKNLLKKKEKENYQLNLIMKKMVLKVLSKN